MGIIDGIIDMIFPYRNICLFCKEETRPRGKHICPNCMGLIELANRQVDFRLPNMNSIYYSALYNRFMVDKLHAFKFRGENYLYKPFGEILLHTIECTELRDGVDCVAFIPAHRLKEALRGYNQSKLLAEYVARQAGIPLLDNHLFKIRRTKDQSSLGRRERMDNLRDCFEGRNVGGFKGKEILLIDDIITTGTTMEECGKVLMKNGASRVYGLTLTSSRYLDR